MDHQPYPGKLMTTHLCISAFVPQRHCMTASSDAPHTHATTATAQVPIQTTPRGSQREGFELALIRVRKTSDPTQGKKFLSGSATKALVCNTAELDMPRPSCVDTGDF